jgi:NitT/TauT family transport system ATP-binding protein
VTTQPSPAAVSFQSVDMAFVSENQEFLALREVDLEIRHGRFVCLLGPSGCGKSTLLNLAAGLTTPTAGRVLFNGVPLRGVNHEVGYITQQDNLLPWSRVEDNVGIALAVRGVRRAERRRRVGEMLDTVGLTGFARRYPAQLSGGMRKRVTLARTLIYNPSTLLMDEPFGALDAQLRAAMQAELLRLWERDRKTVIFVTHDVEEALLLADEIVVFGTNPGRILDTFPVDLDRPRDVVALRTSARFPALVQQLWSMLLPGAQAAAHPRAGSCWSPGRRWSWRSGGVPSAASC